MTDDKRYDVIAINQKTDRIRILTRGVIGANADAVIDMAIARRGVDTEFYTKVDAGSRREGDTYDLGEE